MQVHSIVREHAHKKRKLVARGGKRGKTAGRGGKGQTARAGHRVRPAMRDIIKKLPKLRGHGKNRSKSVFDRGPYAELNLSQLASFAGKEVTPKTLIDAKLVLLASGRTPKIKILGVGEISKALSFSGVLVSAVAKEKIEKAGGKVAEVASKEE